VNKYNAECLFKPEMLPVKHYFAAS